MSTLREAEYFAEAGFNDIIYAVSMVPAKLARAFNDGAGTECSGVLTHAGATELRAGVYVFQDVFQVGLGSCSHTHVALSVLTTVISHKNNQNRIITDAGGVALFKDQSTRGTDFDCGYGLVADVDGTITEFYMSAVPIRNMASSPPLTEKILILDAPPLVQNHASCQIIPA